MERLPPQAQEMEQAVLGAMLIDRRAIGRAIVILDPDCFYHQAHNQIYEAILGLYENNEAVDQLTLAEELRKRDQLDGVGGRVYLATLATQVASAANIDYHARIVLEKALSRKLIETSGQMAEQAYEGHRDIHEVIDLAAQRIFALSERGLSQGFAKLDSVLDETVEHMERVHRQDSAVSGVETGYQNLNDLTSGLQKGELVILAARPSVGKTALGLCIARNAAMEAGVGVGIFSLEMSNMQLAQRLLSIETRLDLHKMRAGRLREEDWMNLTRNISRLAQAPIYIDDSPGITVLEARAKARRLQREHGVGLIVVDYLQLMSGGQQFNSREQEISHISRGLKALAKELNLPVLALAQLSRAVESRTDRRPQLSDLRESGSIEQDADLVMFIYRPEVYDLKGPDGGSLEGFAEIIIGKQRNGPVGNVKMTWNAECATFEDMAPEYMIEQEESY